LGTEDRVSDPAKKVPPSSEIVPYVTFPGMDIKDLLVHDSDSTTTADNPPPPPQVSETASSQPSRISKTSSASKPQHSAPPKPPNTKNSTNNERKQQKKELQQKKEIQHKKAPVASTAAASAPAPAAVPPPSVTSTNASAARGASSNNRSERGGAGTGAHLLKMRERKSVEATTNSTDVKKDFDFAAGLSVFRKEDVYAKVATETAHDGANGGDANTYKKDDFFDSLSCDITDRESGRRSRLSASEERALNQDTFGAIALQNNYRRSFRGGGRGRGRGSGRGRGRYAGRQGVKSTPGNAAVATA